MWHKREDWLRLRYTRTDLQTLALVAMRMIMKTGQYQYKNIRRYLLPLIQYFLSLLLNLKNTRNRQTCMTGMMNLKVSQDFCQYRSIMVFLL